MNSTNAILNENDNKKSKLAIFKLTMLDRIKTNKIVVFGGTGFHDTAVVHGMYHEWVFVLYSHTLIHFHTASRINLTGIRPGAYV